MNYEPKIKKENLIHGTYYYGHCRNATLARWNANEGKFFHWRTKFGTTFIEEIKCPEDEQHFDVFVAEGVCTNPDKEIPFN